MGGISGNLAIIPAVVGDSTKVSGEHATINVLKPAAHAILTGSKSSSSNSGRTANPVMRA
jgi:hypothetical protein